MNTGDRTQAKASGHRGTIIGLSTGHSFTIRYDGERYRGRRIRGAKVTYPWYRLGAFNVGRSNPGFQDG